MILITGATGNVGLPLVRQLKADDVAFRALAHTADSAAKLKAEGITAVVGDYAKPASLEAALKGVEKIYLLSPPTPQMPAHESNVVAAAKRAGIRHIVKHSGIGADPYSPNTFAKWNGQSERAVEESGIAYTILRPSSFMQNLAPSYGQSVAQSGAIYAYGGDARVGFIDTRDIAAAAVAVLTGEGHEGLTYELTGPEAVSLADIAERLSAKLGRPVRYVGVSEAAAYKTLTGYGLPPILVHGMLTLQHFFLRTTVVTGTVERLTGKQPRTVDAYLDETLAAFKG